MKALLLKDFYMLKTCRIAFVVIGIFLLLSPLDGGSSFMSLYPCVLINMIPVSLLGYDEKSGWDRCCGTLPFRKSQIVSVKYLLSLLLLLAFLLLSLACNTVFAAVKESFSMEGLLEIVALQGTISLFSIGATLPFFFRWGVEKGRIAYYVALLMGCVLSSLAAQLLHDASAPQALSGAASLLLLLVFALLFALSWLLSIRFYQKREIA